ncbi:MAG: UDP-3-O-acyl-N-acetylglucosamine deacetylase [Candidatus Omnitrophota bacterium]|nr:UDP-3-O-acyl-N-acetylglucosamine deacetylase [Candidatus Omnitrophota bacterium]
MTRQRTIKDEVSIEGIGLQTGKKVTLRLHGSPPNSGINFIRLDLPNRPLINIQSVTPDNPDPRMALERRTVLGVGPLQIQTTEHLLSAFSGMAIDNIAAELDSEELPGLDGSAKPFVNLLKSAKIIEQDAPRKFLMIERPVWIEKQDSFIAIFPDDFFRVSYTLSYDRPGLGTQFFSIALNEDSYEKQIAPARTFCLEEEALELLKRGLGKGANYDNTLVMGKDGPVKTSLRFPDEPARHKILDLVGDLYLLGLPIKGHVVAIKSGHSLNIELVRKLKIAYSACLPSD